MFWNKRSNSSGDKILIWQIPFKSGILQKLKGCLMPMSGKAMMKLYIQNGWEPIRQSGSRVIMKKGSQRKTIPMHKELKKGLERALLKRLRGGL